MPSVLTLTAFLLREEGGGGLIREGGEGLVKISTSIDGGLLLNISAGGLLQYF